MGIRQPVQTQGFLVLRPFPSSLLRQRAMPGYKTRDRASLGPGGDRECALPRGRLGAWMMPCQHARTAKYSFHQDHIAGPMIVLFDVCLHDDWRLPQLGPRYDHGALADPHQPRQECKPACVNYRRQRQKELADAHVFSLPLSASEIAVLTPGAGRTHRRSRSASPDRSCSWPRWR